MGPSAGGLECGQEACRYLRRELDVAISLAGGAGVNRAADRQLNPALHTVTMVRVGYDHGGSSHIAVVALAA